jgi:hypothetical protein
MGSLSSQSLWYASDAPQPSSHIVPPCHLTAGAEEWSVSCPFPGVLTPLACAKTRSSITVQLSRDSEGAEVGHSSIRHVYLWPLGEVVHGSQKVSIFSLALRKGPAISVTILSNGSSTLYWCIWPRLLVRDLGSLRRCHGWHHLSMSLL